MLDRLKAWLRGDTDPDPRVREALRSGRREWPTDDGGTLRLLSSDEELRMTPEQRWTRHNARAMAEGCPCGRPGFVVRKYPAVGSVPFQVYACEEHRHVTVWERGTRPDGSTGMIPMEDDDDQ
jgi:hypothetical protein